MTYKEDNELLMKIIIHNTYQHGQPGTIALGPLLRSVPAAMLLSARAALLWSAHWCRGAEYYNQNSHVTTPGNVHSTGRVLATDHIHTTATASVPVLQVVPGLVAIESGQLVNDTPLLTDNHGAIIAVHIS